MEAFENFVEKKGNVVNNRMIAWIHEEYKHYNVDYSKPASVYSKILKEIFEGIILLLAKCCPKGLKEKLQYLRV